MTNNSDLIYLDSQVPEGHIMVRGLAIPKSQIDAVEQLYNAEYIDETKIQDRALIARLDQELAKYTEANGSEPEFVKFIDIPDCYFKHMHLTHNLQGFKIPLQVKPAWFRFKRKFSGVSLVKN